MTIDVDFDAWSVKPHPSNDVFKIAQAGIFAMEHLDHPLHLLQVSGTNTMAMVIYLSKYYKHPITYDSSSYARGCIGREYTLPYNLGMSLSFGNQEGDNHRIDELPCMCPVCVKIKANELWQEGSLPGALIALHNLWWYIVYSKTLNTLVDDEELFKKFVSANCNEKTLTAMEFVDYYMETGDAEKAVEKYRPYMSAQTKHTQRSFRI